MTAEVMMKEYKNMKKELTVTEFQLRQFQGVKHGIDHVLFAHSLKLAELELGHGKLTLHVPVFIHHHFCCQKHTAVHPSGKSFHIIRILPSFCKGRREIYLL